MNHNPSKANVCMVAFRPVPKFFNRMKIANALRSNGYDVDFICPIEGSQKNTEVIDGINILRIDSFLSTRVNYVLLNHALLLKDYFAFIVKAFKLVREIDSEKNYVYYHIHSPPDFLILTAISSKIFHKSKIILDLHDMLPEAVASNFEVEEGHILVKLGRLAENISIRCADAVICTNAYDKKIVLSRNNIDKNKIYVIMNSPDLDLLKITPGNKTEYGLCDKYIVIFEGTLWKRRGIQTLIESINILKCSINIYLLVVGDGPYLANLKDMVHDLDIDEYVMFTGWVEPKMLSKYISISDLGVIPFLRTKVNERGVPNKLFEYIIYEKPIVASRLKGMEYVFNDDQICFFEPGNPNDLADKIKWCHDNKHKAMEMARIAKERYEKEYTWARMKEELYKCYDSI